MNAPTSLSTIGRSTTPPAPKFDGSSTALRKVVCGSPEANANELSAQARARSGPMHSTSMGSGA